ncbi:ribonuclease H-like domain-containing protein [Tanacetum coccineum]
MDKEMKALYNNDTWEITELPSDRKAIGKGVDFDETFSPVVKIVIVGCLLNLVVQNSWPLYQLDINNAFLYGDLDETIYMTLPEGFFSPNDKRVCKLKKFLYGLKQSPRQWNAKLTQALIGNGFSQSKSDYSLFTKSNDHGFLALLVYVDDIIVTGSNVLEIKNVPGQMGVSCQTYDNPMLVLILILTEYQNLIGKLIYLTHTIPNIAYSIHCLIQSMHKALKSRIKIALKVLRYLKGSPSKGIHISKNKNTSLEVFVDAEWAKCVVTRKSVTVFCIFFNGSLVSWKSKKQKTLSKSSTEAEYRVIASATSETIWILKILKYLNWGHFIPAKEFCDSQAVIKIAANPVFHERTKHLEIDLHFVRDKINFGVIETKKVSSADQTANVLTKRLDKIQNDKLVSKMGMIDVFQVKVKG